MISTAENWKRINEAVAFEAERCGRKPEEVKVMAVTKLHAAEEIRPLIESGCCLFGENRLAESLEKWPQLNREGVSLHLIGHLQTNKVKYLIGKTRREYHCQTYTSVPEIFLYII